MLDVKRLRVLHEVARQGSFSAAADALSYTQSAVSQQIAALERETGTTLVDRGARGIHLRATRDRELPREVPRGRDLAQGVRPREKRPDAEGGAARHRDPVRAARG